MTKWEKFKHSLYLFRCDFLDGTRNLRRKIWNKRIKLWWHKLFIRKDEFHLSLNMDAEAMMVMNKEELKRYFDDLRRRRRIAHNRDLAKENSE
ncbi:MAG: hypothetical protein AAB352_01305 [Patescibacteria group bacterium]